MKEESATLPVLKDSSGSCDETAGSEILRKYSFGRRIPKNRDPSSVKQYSRTKPKNESKLSEKLNPSNSFINVTMPSPIEMKQSSDGESEKVKTNSKRKIEIMSEAAILRSVLRPQGVPVPVDKVGIVREPQVIVRKFNIPVLCPSSSPKFTKLKERWKYQHDVVGLTNVNPTNPLHSIMKSKPVVSYSVASFVNDSPASPPKAGTPSVPKFVTSTILPKNHIVASNRLPLSSTSSNIGVIPTSLPSTPTAVVKPVQILPTSSANHGSIEPGKYLILKTVESSECGSDVESESEAVSTINSKSKGKGKSKELQNGKIYLNPFAEVKQNTDTVEEMETDQVDSLEDISSDANTLHLEILSECGTRNFKCSLTDTGDLVTNLSSASVPFSQEETVISIPNPHESDLLNQAKTFSFPHSDKPLTLITVPTSGSGTMSQVLLKPQSVGNLVPITATTPAPRLVTSISNPTQQPDGSGHKKTFQLSPLTLSNGIQQKEKVLLKSLQTQPISVSPTKLQRIVTNKCEPMIVTNKGEPVIVTNKGEPVTSSKVKNDMVVLKSRPLQNGMDNLKNNNLTLLTARQSIALQYQRDLIKEQEEIRIPRAVSYPARNVELLDTSCQTNLFSLLEAGRFVEMSFSVDPKELRVSGNTSMPAPIVRVANLNNANRASTPLPTIKRLVPVDTSGRVVMVGSSTNSSTEPVTKKMKLDNGETNAGNIFKLLCSPPSQASNANVDNKKQTAKNINELPCDNLIQQHNITLDGQSKLELNGLEAMVVDPNDILPDKTSLPRQSSVDKKMLIQTAYNDWKNCLKSDEEGNFPLHNAVLDEDLKQVKRQCYVLKARHESIDIRNAEKQTPLHLAVWLGCPHIVQALLQFGSCPDLVDFKGNNALHLATEKTSNLECLETLLQLHNCKKFINCLNHDGYSPLHLCALSGKCHEVIALVKSEADINLRDGKSGRTALFHSVEGRDSNMSRLLVQYGASASVTNFAGQTPLLATNDMSMLGEHAMASVIMSRNSLSNNREKGDMDDSWKIFETEDR